MSVVPSSAQPRYDNPKVVWSWAMYDWANSAFTTLVVTFIYSFYFANTFFTDESTGTLWWSRAAIVSSILTALASPVFGAAADRGGSRKKFLLITTTMCVAATTVLTFISPAMANGPLIALAVFVVADISFEVGNVFYNAFLPSIASPARIGRVSGWGWGLGYVGGTVCMLVALVGFASDAPWFGMSKVDGWNVRATNLLVAAWFLLFSLPLFLVVPETRTGAARISMKAAFEELRQTASNIGRYRELVKFLLARLVFNDGLVTVFAFGSIYASKVFGMSLKQVIFFGIVLNVTSGLGAFLFGSIDDRIGGKKTIMISIVMMTVATGMAVWAPTVTWFWVSGILLGIFVGPNQSASRSLMGRFVPEKRQSEFFGFFAFSGKATAFMGPFLMGQLTSTFSSHRVGMASVILFFSVGGLLLMSVDEAKGMAAAQEG